MLIGHGNHYESSGPKFATPASFNQIKVWSDGKALRLKTILHVEKFSSFTQDKLLLLYYYRRRFLSTSLLYLSRVIHWHTLTDWLRPKNLLEIIRESITCRKFVLSPGQRRGNTEEQNSNRCWHSRKIWLISNRRHVAHLMIDRQYTTYRPTCT